MARRSHYSTAHVYISVVLSEMFITSAKEVMFSSALVDPFVCLLAGILKSYSIDFHKIWRKCGTNYGSNDSILCYFSVMVELKLQLHVSLGMFYHWRLLHCTLASCSALYCNRSCLWPGLWVCLCVCGSVSTITQNCVHRSSQTGFVRKGSVTISS